MSYKNIVIEEPVSHLSQFYRLTHIPEIVYMLQKDYWNYVRDFPSHITLPADTENAAREALVCYLTGVFDFIPSIYQTTQMFYLQRV